MNMRTAVLVIGIVFIVGAVAGFFPAPIPPGSPPLTIEEGHGLAFGLLPVNLPHNIVHLLFGILGIAAFAGVGLGVRAYFQLVAIVYALLTVLGLIPATQTTFGLVPIWGNDVWFHAVLAAIAAYFAFMAPPIGLPTRR